MGKIYGKIIKDNVRLGGKNYSTFQEVRPNGTTRIRFPDLGLNGVKQSFKGSEILDLKVIKKAKSYPEVKEYRELGGDYFAKKRGLSPDKLGIYEVTIKTPKKLLSQLAKSKPSYVISVGKRGDEYVGKNHIKKSLALKKARAFKRSGEKYVALRKYDKVRGSMGAREFI